MLIQFRIENHRSLREEQQLSLAAAGLGTDDDPRLIRVDALSEPLLSSIAIYGANASGKSNVLHGLAFMRSSVMFSHLAWAPDTAIPTEPFASSEGRNAPSLYETEILSAGTRFRYGFVLSRQRVEEEWLYAWPNGHKQTWFEREGDSFKFGANLRGDNEAIRNLTRNNSLFLSVAAQNNHAALTPVFRWFRLLRVSARRRNAFPQAPALARMFSRQRDLFRAEDSDADRKSMLELLRAADTGIVDLRVEDAERETTRRPSIEFRHRSELQSENDGFWLPLEVESSGTIALVEMGPRLTSSLRSGGVLCIDEMEASLHPMLALSILSLFNDPIRNPKRTQLIFTTHDTNLLGPLVGAPPLRRDQVWFTEKDATGGTHLYPLSDFHPRKHENLERGYLQGRYGAVPFLGDLGSISIGNKPSE